MDNERPSETIKEKAKKKVEEWKTRFEELELQMSLGEKEAEEYFHKKRDDFKSFIDESREKLAGLEESGSEKATELKNKLNDLKEQLSASKDDVEAKLEEHSASIESTIENITSEMKALASTAGVKFNDFFENFDRASEDFKSKADAYRVQFSLAKSDAKDTIEDKKKELKAKIAEAKSIFEKNKGQAEEKFDEFSNEMKEAFGHLKKGFKSFLG